MHTYFPAVASKLALAGGKLRDAHPPLDTPTKVRMMRTSVTLA
jgi:hypothetical protein